MRIIIYDFEIFRYDTLLGAIILHENGNKELYQTWDEDDIRDFYYEHKEDIWIGHNNFSYDDLILEQIVKKRNPYEMSKKIINEGMRGRCRIYLYSWDIMTVRRTPFSLKLTELISGKNIHQSDVDFDLDRNLTEEEKKLTEEYNKDDLEQTLYNFQKFYNQFKLRIDIIKLFNLDLMENLRVTGTQLAASVLGAKKDPSLKYKHIQPILWPTLRLKNRDIINFYLNEDFREGKNISVVLCGCEHKLGAGGIHAALNKVHYDKVLYFDVSGYYNLVMLNLDLLPRTMPEESKELYRFMYNEQLRLKGDPEKVNERKSYKTILLSVFGAMNNEYTDFYDPAKALLVTISGQLFLVDLLEKLEGLVQVIQSNTDGVMMVPFNWEDESKIDEIVTEWQKRTGFVLEKEYLYNLWQRDVNCYFALDKKEEVDYKGDVINYITDDNAYGACKLFDAKEPPIIAKGLIDYLLFEILPEDTVEKNKNDLRNFQYSCKKGTFDYMTCDRILLIPKGKKMIEELFDSQIVKPLNRVFAGNVGYIDDYILITRLVKHKDPSKKGTSTQKVSNLPDSVFIYNEDITNPSDELKEKINWQYYIDRIYEKVLEFVPDEI